MLYTRNKKLTQRIEALEGVPVTISAATSLTKEVHASRLLLLNAATNLVVTLPAATGSGDIYEFVVDAVNTSGYAIKVANGTDVIRGPVHMLQDGGDTSVAFEVASTADTLTLNGTTTGGAAVGDRLVLQDMKSGFWLLKDAVLTGTGTEATPASATVS